MTYGQQNGTIASAPAVGDAVVFNYDNTTSQIAGYADHVALIVAVSGDQVTSIGGNEGNVVQQDTWSASDPSAYWPAWPDQIPGTPVKVTYVAPVTGQAPANPGTPVATGSGSTQINLSWGASPGATGYNVVRWENDNGAISASEIATNVSETSLVDTGLTPSAEYAYSVDAENAAGTSSWVASNTVVLPPPAPGAAVATATGSLTVHVAWGASPGATGYNVDRWSLINGNLTVIGIASDANETSLTDTVQAPGGTYAYSIQAVAAGTTSSWIGSNATVTGKAVGITRASTSSTTPGYDVMTATGHDYAYGSASYQGGAFASLPSGWSIVGVASTPDGKGYWALSNTGAVYAIGDASYHGNANLPSGWSAVGIAPTADGGGYWILSNTGAVYSFGDATYHGNASLPSGWSAVGIAPTSSSANGGGYWILANTGSIYALGNATYEGGSQSIV